MLDLEVWIGEIPATFSVKTKSEGSQFGKVGEEKPICIVASTSHVTQLNHSSANLCLNASPFIHFMPLIQERPQCTQRSPDLLLLRLYAMAFLLQDVPKLTVNNP